MLHDELVADAEPTQNTLRTRFFAWAALMIAMLIVFGVIVVPKLSIETDILALLPSTHDAVIDDALDKLTASLAQRQIILIGSPDAATAKKAALAFADSLAASKQFKNVAARVGGDLNLIVGAYEKHWSYLLADRDRARLQTNDGQALFRDALRDAYTPSGMMRVLPLAQDPLGLRGGFLQQQLPSLGNARLEDSMLVAEHDGKHYVLVSAETDGSIFSSDAQDRLVPALESATAVAQQLVGDSGEIVISGALQHAAAATRQAKNEINTFGSIETVAVLALLFYVFGRFRPLLLGAGVLGLSAAAAITASHFIFGQLHILALVFGASLIGVVIDYSMHFFADQFRTPEKWTPASAVAHVGPAIMLGMFTTMVGYAGLVLMPFPGLRQIAAFCMVGIAIGCGSVIFLYPLLMGARRKALPLRGPKLAAKLDRFLQSWSWTPLKLLAVMVLSIIAIAGALRLRSQDDIRALQASPAQLIHNEQRVQEILGGGIETRFFLVQGDDVETLLQREEQLRVQLDQNIAARSLGGYIALTRALPSLQRQDADHDLMLKQVYAADGPYVRILSQFGFGAGQINARLQEIDASQPLNSDTWLASTAAESYRYLWLGKSGEQYASVVTLSGIHDVGKLDALSNSIAGVRFVDRPHQVSDVMSKYRQVTAWLLIVANLAAFAVLCWRFGWRDAARLALPSVAACVTTLGIFGWLGIGVNLFNIFALLLVFALGIDYGIFLMHGRTARVTAILSVTLSACTTLIGFGMLSFSATPFIRSIGSTLLLGIVCSWVFVMLSCMTFWKRERKVPQH